MMGGMPQPAAQDPPPDRPRTRATTDSPTTSPWACLTGTQRALVLALMQHGQLSRPALMELLSVSPGSITRLATPLVEAGLLVSRTEQVASTGRPQSPLALRAQTESVLGVTLSGTTLTAVLTDLSLAPVATVRYRLVSHRPQDVADQVAAALSELTATACTAASPAEPGSGSGSGDGSGSSSGSGSDVGTGGGSGVGVGTGGGSGVGVGTGTGSSSGTSSGNGTGTGSGVAPGSGTSSGTATSSGSRFGVSPGSGTDTGTSDEPTPPVDQLPPPSCIGLTLGGSSPDGRLISEAVFLGWRQVPLAQMIQERTGVPTTIGNDLGGFTLAESWFGVGKEQQTFCLLTVGAGVGFGMVVQGRVQSSVDNDLGLLGMVPVPDDGEPPTALPAKDCLTNHALEQAWAGKGHPARTAQEVLDAAQAGEADAVAVCRQLARRLGRLIGTAAAFCLPEVVVVAGEMSAVASLLEDEVRTGINQVRRLEAEPVRLVVRQHNRVDWARGAAALALRERVRGRL